MKVKIKPVLASPEFKVLHISGEAGDVLERHKVTEPGLLLVKKGTISYQEEGQPEMQFSENEGHNIPPEIFHKVSCVNQAEIFVFIPQKATLRFKKEA